MAYTTVVERTRSERVGRTGAVVTEREGRPRDMSIDARVLAVAAQHLALHGYQAMSLAAVAEEAGTSRQALYRRWAGKAELAVAVVATIADTSVIAPAGSRNDDPFADLVAELADFQRGVSRPGRLSLVGTMLQDSTEDDVVTRYRIRVVAPRRRRIRTILERAQVLGLVDADADIDLAVPMCTGSWYGRALTGTAPARCWPERTAALVWRAIGGRPPETTQANS